MEDWLAARPLAYRGEHLAAEWWPVRAIFSELHMRFMSTIDSAPRERGHTLRVLYFSGVHPEARRSGVIAGLWHAAVDVARSNGYSSITAQASSEASRKMLKNELGFVEVASVPFVDYEVKGEDSGGMQGYTGAVFKALEQRSANARLSIHRRSIPSDLY
jgi:GNAT superfamily N-acetyltransferase